MDKRIQQRALIALLGLGLVIASTVVAFRDPFGLWHWMLLIAAGGCLFALQRFK